MLWMPTSNVTRVRRDGFSKISARNLPQSDVAYRSGRALMSAASRRHSRVRPGLHSEPVSKSFDNKMDVGRVVAVTYTSLRHAASTEAPRLAGTPLTRPHGQ